MMNIERRKVEGVLVFRPDIGDIPAANACHFVVLIIRAAYRNNAGLRLHRIHEVERNVGTCILVIHDDRGRTGFRVFHFFQAQMIKPGNQRARGKKHQAQYSDCPFRHCTVGVFPCARREEGKSTRN